MSRLRHPLITLARLRKRALVYLRQSTMEQVRENWGSTSLQRDQVELAQSYGWPQSMIDLIDEDLGRSGASTGHRTGWQQMLRQLPTGTVGAVFTSAVSRLSRELRDFEELRLLAKMYGAILVIDGRPADPADPNDTVLLQVQAAFWQCENHSRAKSMDRARREKARQGCLVSRLPVGWIQLADDSFAFDPEVCDAIKDVYPVFWQEQSILATVRALTNADKLLPVRCRRRIVWKPPQSGTVREILLNPAYAGMYVYGASESRPELGRQANGYAKRRPAPREKWIVVPNHHPAYVTVEEQERIRAIIQSKCFSRRERPGRGSALAQGLLYCARCGVRLSVQYPRQTASHRYECRKNVTTFARVRCFDFGGKDLDEALERVVLQRLAAPPIEQLRRSLAEAREGALTAERRLQAEHKRLLFAEQVVRDRYEQCDPRNRLVALDAEERLERAMQARIEFEQRLATHPAPDGVVSGADQELEVLCDIVRDLPSLWRHPLVTDKERKEILSAIIERIDIDVIDEAITGRIRWRAGAESDFRVLRRAGVHRLILELHAEGLSVPEMAQRLRQPHPETGQTWTYCRTALHRIIRRHGLRCHIKRHGRVARVQPERGSLGAE